MWRIALAGGVVVNASSPLTTDSATRIATVMRAIGAREAREVETRLARGQSVDELAAIAAVAGLDGVAMAALATEVVRRRAARTFGVQHAAVAIEDAVTLPVSPGVMVDVREVVFLGARSFLSDAKLAAEVRGFGASVVLAPDVESELEAFGFGDVVAPVLESLRAGAVVAELPAMHPAVDPRLIQAVVYALVTCGGALEATTPRLARASMAPPFPEGPSVKPSVRRPVGTDPIPKVGAGVKRDDDSKRRK